MKFQDYKYERPNYEEIKKSFSDLVNKIKTADNYKDQHTYIMELNNIRKHIETMSTLASIRNSINTADEFYEKETQYWDEYDFSEQFYKICEYSLKSFYPEIIPDLQEENKLMSRYTKLLASAKINFNNEELNLSGLYKYMLSQDRKEREESSKAYYNYFEIHEEEFDEIYDKLVKVRHDMAKKLGFNNFTELGYIRMDRTYSTSL